MIIDMRNGKKKRIITGEKKINLGMKATAKKRKKENYEE